MIATPGAPTASGLTVFEDRCVGETRTVVTDAEGRAVRLRVERWSRPADAPRLGAHYVGRVAQMASQFRGAFVDLGLDMPGFLPFREGRAPKGLHEGAWVSVEIAAEASPGKGPRVRRLPGTPAGPARCTAPAPTRDPDIAAWAQADGWVTGAEARSQADAAQEEALAQIVPLPGGGDVAIEPTRGLTAMDVDAGGRAADRDAERFALQTNLAASSLIVRQIGVRSLGGLVVIDFVSLRSTAAKARVREALQAACAALRIPAQVGPLSPRCLCEITVTRTHQPLHELALRRDGAASDETLALEALRALEREGAAQRAAHLTLVLAPGAHDWLAADAIAWRAAMTQRLGPRFALEADPNAPRTRVDVRAAWHP